MKDFVVSVLGLFQCFLPVSAILLWLSGNNVGIVSVLVLFIAVTGIKHIIIHKS